MREITGDIFKLAQKGDAILVTTNGCVKKDGTAVMGRGIAKQAAERYPGIAKTLAECIKLYGNMASWLGVWDGVDVFSLPTKQDWRTKSDIELIQASCERIATLVAIDGHGPKINNIYMTRPGCGNGWLKWEDVKPVIEPLLDDRFVVVTPGENDEIPADDDKAMPRLAASGKELPDLDQAVTVCFTGHRPNKLAGYDQVNYNGFVDSLTQIIRNLYAEGFRNFVTGGAQGVDQLIFWAVLRVRKEHDDIRNIVFVPFDGQERKWAAAGLFSQRQYAQMLREADGIFVCTDDKSTNYRDVAGFLTNRNHDMCMVSSRLVACYGGIDYHTEKGGTAECMRYWEENCSSQGSLEVHPVSTVGTLSITV